VLAFPSPDHYKPTGTISPSGYYFPSKFHSSKCRTFSREKREYYNCKGYSYLWFYIDVEDQPGPGIYRAPSEFGYYESILREKHASKDYNNNNNNSNNNKTAV